MTQNKHDDAVIVLSGEAGQGIQSIEGILMLLLKRSGYNVFSASEFMSRVRGGINSTEIRISPQSVAGYRDRIDILIPLHPKAIPHLQKRITGETRIIDVDFSDIASKVGNAIYSNTVAAGLICGLLRIDTKESGLFIDEYFSKKNDDVRSKNQEAFKKGYEEGSALPPIGNLIQKKSEVKKHLLMAGAESIALGALAGGCNYVCGYPMSPATSVLEHMASLSLRHDILVEQVEDEVGVVNMALGAWYAGARAFVSTSGGGFALMTEGISLCGMIESPLVLHLAQRPGPATGLPTRTEQGDLNLVLYAGHGDFPRIILAPGTLEQGFTLTQSAFSLADEYQVPVFILTDQFFVDSKYNTPSFDTSLMKADSKIVKTDKNYKRFRFSETGISPRGIPGYGDGVVCADSDEHDESGHITESMDMRVKMVLKRNKKFDAIEKSIIPPTLTGPENYTTLVICWGSTYNTVVEAVEELRSSNIAVLHFSWVFPLPKNTAQYLSKASTLIAVENNYSGQFTALLSRHAGIAIPDVLLKFDGLPFMVEEVMTGIRDKIQSGAHNAE